MVQIIFSYSGIINGVNIQGGATMNSDPASGDINAVANFNSFPNDFHPSLMSNSLLSVSCSNGGKAINGAQNILTLSNGQYTSVRDVEIYDSGGQLLGNITINGSFQKVQTNLYTAAVTLTGTYSGPTDIEFPNGYNLPLSPVNSNKLEGSFQKNINTISGQTLSTVNNHVYLFNNGVTSSLEDANFELTYNTDESYWLPEEKILNLVGNSVISPQ